MKWINVKSSKLPAPYETVLVTAKMKEDKEYLVYQACRRGNNTWDLIGVSNSSDYNVIAWQPLPEPYKPLKITKEEFELYEFVRASGVTNMWAIDTVSNLSGLDKKEIMYIMEHYDELYNTYMKNKKTRV